MTECCLSQIEPDFGLFIEGGGIASSSSVGTRFCRISLEAQRKLKGGDMKKEPLTYRDQRGARLPSAVLDDFGDGISRSAKAAGTDWRYVMGTV